MGQRLPEHGNSQKFVGARRGGEGYQSEVRGFEPQLVGGRLFNDFGQCLWRRLGIVQINGWQLVAAIFVCQYESIFVGRIHEYEHDLRMHLPARHPSAGQSTSHRHCTPQLEFAAITHDAAELTADTATMRLYPQGAAESRCPGLVEPSVRPQFGLNREICQLTACSEIVGDHRDKSER